MFEARNGVARNVGIIQLVNEESEEQNKSIKLRTQNTRVISTCKSEPEPACNKETISIRSFINTPHFYKYSEYDKYQ